MPNDMTISQAGAVLNSIAEQATYQGALSPIETPEDFVSVAQTLLRMGTDPIINAVSQVWSNTMYAVRPYNAKFTSLEMSLDRYGNAIRKLSPVAREMIDDQRFTWPVCFDSTHTDNPFGNGESVDHYRISKQEVLQTNFYGTAVYSQRYTVFKDQFDTAFRSADDFMRFNSMNLTERSNDKESYREAVARGLQANFIGGIIAENNAHRVIHLLTEYNTATGLSLTAQTVYQPANFNGFMRWVYARIKTLARMMSERSEMFQTIIDGKPILRHTPSDKLRIALYAPAMEQINSMVLSDAFNDNYLKYAKYEGVNFWQSIATPDTINIEPVYTSTDGNPAKGNAVNQSHIFGLMHDLDALGYCYTNVWSATTPLNIDGGYWNTNEHSTIKTIQDNTEKAVVLLLD